MQAAAAFCAAVACKGLAIGDGGWGHRTGFSVCEGALGGVYAVLGGRARGAAGNCDRNERDLDLLRANWWTVREDPACGALGAQGAQEFILP